MIFNKIKSYSCYERVNGYKFVKKITNVNHILLIGISLDKIKNLWSIKKFLCKAENALFIHFCKNLAISV